MIYAQINNGKVINTIVVDSTTPLDLFSREYDYFFRIDLLSPMPGINWIYDGQNFSAPPQQIDEIEG